MQLAPLVKLEIGIEFKTCFSLQAVVSWLAGTHTGVFFCQHSTSNWKNYTGGRTMDYTGLSWVQLLTTSTTVSGKQISWIKCKGKNTWFVCGEWKQDVFVSKVGLLSYLFSCFLSYRTAPLFPNCKLHPTVFELKFYLKDICCPQTFWWLQPAFNSIFTAVWLSALFQSKQRGEHVQVFHQLTVKTFSQNKKFPKSSKSTKKWQILGTKSQKSCKISTKSQKIGKILPSRVKK